MKGKFLYLRFYTMHFFCRFDFDIRAYRPTQQECELQVGCNSRPHNPKVKQPSLISLGLAANESVLLLNHDFTVTNADYTRSALDVDSLMWIPSSPFPSVFFFKENKKYHVLWGSICHQPTWTTSLSSSI